MADNKVASFGFVPADDTDTQPAATSTTSSGDFGFVPADSGPRKPDPLPTEVAKKIDKDKASFAKNASPIVGIPPGDIYARPNPAAKALYGPSDNAGSAFSKLETYLKNTALDQQINQIHGSYPLGPLPSEPKEVNELEKQKSGNTFQGIQKFTADVISGIGTYAVGVGQKIDYGAQAISEAMQGTVALGFKSLGVQMNPDTAEYHFDMSAEAQRNFTAVGIGAAKRAARERGRTGEVSSLITAEILDLGNTLMLGFPAGRAQEAAQAAFANVVVK